ncbi:MAG: hypothetical protein ACLR5S_08340 [Ruminococcus sp.]
MKLKKLLAAVTTGVLAVTSLSLSGLVSSAEVQELMNDTFESGYGAWKGVGSPVPVHRAVPQRRHIPVLL